MRDRTHPGSTTGVDRLLAGLARRTSSGRYLPEIDGLRFVSIVMVLLFHVAVVTAVVHGHGRTIGTFGQATGGSGGGWAISILQQGGFGVYIFFVISGFVLALPFLAARLTDGESVDLKRYLLRRLTRIEPPYVVVMTGVFLGLWLLGDAPSFGHYGTGMLYLHQFWFGIANPVNGVSWTLEVEMQFYLVVPLLALALGSANLRVRRMSIVLCCLIVSAIQAGGAMDDPHLAAFLLASIQFFLVGWLLADIYLVDWSSDPQAGRVWDLVSLIGWPFLVLGLVEWVPFRPIVAPWLVLALFVAAFRGPVTRRVLSNRWITTIGGMCYSIYLTHGVVMLTVGRAFARIRTWSPELDVLIFGVLVLVPVSAVALALFVWVERPCMDPEWASRLYGRAAGWRRSGSIHVTAAPRHGGVIVIPEAAPSVDVVPVLGAAAPLLTSELGAAGPHTSASPVR